MVTRDSRPRVGSDMQANSSRRGRAARFFSSRRRHTRSKRDWSSDVCSSDLAGDLQPARDAEVVAVEEEPIGLAGARDGAGHARGGRDLLPRGVLEAGVHPDTWEDLQIGRASCRERGTILEVAGYNANKSQRE